MRLTSLTLCFAVLAGTTPVLAQTGAPLTPSSTTGVMRQPLAPTTGHAVKSTTDTDRRLIEEQKRLERIMTICIGC